MDAQKSIFFFFFLLLDVKPACTELEKAHAQMSRQTEEEKDLLRFDRLPQ